jgi:hypothetical protein
MTNLSESVTNVVRDFAPFWNSTSHLLKDVTTEVAKMSGLYTPAERDAAFNFIAATIVSVPGLLANLTNSTGLYDWNISRSLYWRICTN